MIDGTSVSLAFPRAQPDPMPFPLMTLRSLKFIAILSSLAVPAMLSAQVSSSEEERLVQLMADSANWYVPKTTVSIGFRMLSSSGSVAYGNLGRVDSTLPVVPPISAGPADRIYDDGVVSKDSSTSRAEEATADTTTIPGRYLIYKTVTVEDKDTDGNVTGTHEEQVLNNNYLAYAAGVTRGWAYSNESQLTGDGRIAFHTYSASSQGGTAFKDTGASAGVEFQVNRMMGKMSGRTEWGITAGIALNGINNKTSGTVLSTLHTTTDLYNLNGQTLPAAPYSGPSFGELLDSAGNLVNSVGLETTTPLADTPSSQTSATTVDGVNVNGRWQVHGAYFMVRLGPSVRAQLTQRLGLSASLGLAGAYAGSIYSASESFEMPNSDGVMIATADPEQSRMTKFLSGYYADLNLEWAATERTGLFGGVSAQQFGDYEQVLNGRTANVDLGSTVGIRGGVSIKF